MEITKATKEDLEQIIILEKENFISSWTREQYEYEFYQNEYSTILVAKEQNQVIGYIAYWCIFEHADINKVLVIDQYKHQGLGTKLMLYAEDDIQKKGCNIISLEVRKSNFKAIGLYEKLDYIRIRTMDKYYPDGEDALFMMKGV
jgi:ribosomal-protein-alanine N-acetyltransferase